MDRDANYVAVGAFVLLVIAMAVSFVFWYTDQQDKRTTSATRSISRAP
jgi:phospholipid/cholesterol/gamma-HCH transport system substrate-binding protein